MKSLPEILRRWSSNPVVFFLWVGAVFLACFSAKTFDLSFLSAFSQDRVLFEKEVWAGNALHFAVTFILCAWIGLATWRVGKRVGQRLGILPATGSRVFFEWAFGILLLNTFWMGLGLNGLWFDLLSKSFLVLLLFWALVDHVLDREKVTQGGIWAIGAYKRPLLFLVGAFVLLDLFQIFTPVTYFDGVVYHLSTLRFWQFHHGLAASPWNFFTCYPFGGELYLWNGLMIGDTEAAKGLNILVLFMTAGMAVTWVAEVSGITAGWLTGAAVLFVPLFSTAVWSAQNDLLLVFFILLFVQAFQKAIDRGNVRWFILAGLMGGGAWTIKQTAVLGLILFSLIGLVTQVRKGSVLWGRWWGMAAGMVVLALPWFLKNEIYMGNPVYPYLSHWIGGQTFSPENTQVLMAAHESPWAIHFSLWQWLVQVGVRCSDKTIAPLLLSFLPLWFLTKSDRSLAIRLGWSALFYLLVCFLISYQLRLAAPALVLLFIAMGMSLDGAQARRWSLVVLAFGALSFISLARVSMDYFHWDRMVLGTLNRQDFLEKDPQTNTYYGLTQAVDRVVAPGERVLLVGDSRSLYFTRDFVANSLYDPQELDRLAQSEPDGKSIHHRLFEMGIDDLVVSGIEGHRLAGQDGFYRMSDKDWAKLDDLAAHWMEPVYQEGPWTIYRLRSQPQAAPTDSLNALRSLQGHS